MNTSAQVILGCTATDVKIDAGRDAGQLIGRGYENTCDSNCSATNVTVVANGSGTGANIKNEFIGRL